MLSIPSIWSKPFSPSSVHIHPRGAKRTRSRIERWRMTEWYGVFRSPVLPQNAHEDSAKHAVRPRTARALQKGDPAGAVEEFALAARNYQNDLSATLARD